jgi:hypothetical protein
MARSGDEVVLTQAEAQEHYRLELLAEAVDGLKQQAARYCSEPSPEAWADFLRALAAVTGDSEAYSVLRAMKIHGIIERRTGR